MWPVGLTEDEATRIRDDLRDMRRARRLARCIRWLERALDSNHRRRHERWTRSMTEEERRLFARASKQCTLIHDLQCELVDVCHG
jgi:hypothetical protein